MQNKVCFYFNIFFLFKVFSNMLIPNKEATLCPINQDKAKPTKFKYVINIRGRDKAIIVPIALIVIIK